MNRAQRIINCRKSLGWSQAELSRKIGVSKATTCHWEADTEGKIDIKRPHLEAMAKAFNRSIAWIETGRDSMAYASADENLLIRVQEAVDELLEELPNREHYPAKSRRQLVASMYLLAYETGEIPSRRILEMSVKLGQ